MEQKTLLKNKSQLIKYIEYHKLTLISVQVNEKHFLRKTEYGAQRIDVVPNTISQKQVAGVLRLLGRLQNALRYLGFRKRNETFSYSLREE